MRMIVAVYDDAKVPQPPERVLNGEYIEAVEIDLGDEGLDRRPQLFQLAVIEPCLARLRYAINKHEARTQ